MLMPSIFGENLFNNDWMDFSFPDVDKVLYGKHAKNVMKTDVKETDISYEVDIDLPGFKKDEIEAKLENGYLTISAAKGLDKEEKDKGSVIVVIATDVPLTSRQLKRVAKRASIGLGRAGSYLGNGSGDIAIAFSTANIIPHYNGNRPIEIRMISDDCIDKVFEAVVETVEESVISSLYHSHTVKGIRNKTVFGLLDMLEMHSE